MRMVSERALEDDPLRSLRAVRIAIELGLEIDPATGDAAARHAPGIARVANERVFAELKRVISADDVRRGLARDGGVRAHPGRPAGAGRAARDRAEPLPPPGRLRPHARGARQRRAAAARSRSPRGSTTRCARCWPQPLSDELTRGEALRWAALLHDAAKPRRAACHGGRVTFMGHDAAGAQLARDVLGRLKASSRLRDYVAAVTLHHLDAGFLVHERPLDRRTIWRYLRATQPYSADITIFTVADRLATRGRQRRARDRGAPRGRARAARRRPRGGGGRTGRAAGARRRARARGRRARGQAPRRDPRPARGGPLRGRDRHARRGARARAGAGGAVNIGVRW